MVIKLCTIDIYKISHILLILYGTAPCKNIQFTVFYYKISLTTPHFVTLPQNSHIYLYHKKNTITIQLVFYQA